MKNFLRIVIWPLLITICGKVDGQVNSAASEKTKTLYANLKILQNSDQFLFGQEFFNSFQFSSGSAHGNYEISDSKSVTGSHPALLGSDFHYYIEKNATEKGYHTEALKWAYQQGYAITFDWHMSGRNYASYEYRAENKDLVNNIVNNVNGDRDWLYQQFDKAIEIINNDLVVNGERIPIVFRPWHEMNGGWFWWGSQATTSANYKTLYQLTVDYFKTRTTSVLFCWSPNSPTDMNYYPGDDYVDVLGVDIYEVTSTSLRNNIAPIVDYAQANNKVAVLSETGNRTSNGDNAATYWKSTVLPAIMDDPSGKARKIAWVLTWINASWSYAYVPHNGSSSTAKQSFISFKESANVLFGNEIQSMYTTWEVPVAVEPEAKSDNHIQVFPVPAEQTINIILEKVNLPASVSVIDSQGKLVNKWTVNNREFTLNRALLPCGTYVIRVSSGNEVYLKKIVLQ